MSATTGGSNAANQLIITYGARADASKVSAYSISVLEAVMLKSGVERVQITSTARDAQDQARVMYNNIVKHGADAQKELYGKSGDKVIDAYTAAMKAGDSKASILAKMVQKINQVGVQRVTNHAADPNVLNVFDVGTNSIAPQSKKNDFMKAAREEPRVAKFLDPSNNDPGCHFEIPQKKS